MKCSPDEGFVKPPALFEDQKKPRVEMNDPRITLFYPEADLICRQSAKTNLLMLRQVF